MTRSKVATVRAGKSAAGKAKAGKMPPRRKPAKRQSRVDAQKAAEELAEKVFHARLKFHRWAELASALFENQYRRLVTPEGEGGDEDEDYVLTKNELSFLPQNDLRHAEYQLEELREVLDSMIAELQAL